MLQALQRMLGQHDWNHDPKPLTAWQSARLFALGDSNWGPSGHDGNNRHITRWHHLQSSAVSQGQSKQAPVDVLALQGLPRASLNTQAQPHRRA